MGVSTFVEKEFHTTILLNDMNISRLTIYEQQVEDCKIRELSRKGKRPRLDYSSHQSLEKRFYPQDYSLGNMDRDPKKYSQSSGHSYERERCPTYGKQHGVIVLLERMVFLHVLIRDTR